MKKFNFRLETLLKYRELQEEEAQLRFSRAVERYNRELARATALENQLEQAFFDFYKRQQEILTIETLKTTRYFIDNLKERLNEQHRQVALASEQRDLCLAVLEDAAKKRKLVAKLKEKRWNEYQILALQAEQKFLDELGGQVYFKDSQVNG